MNVSVLFIVEKYVQRDWVILNSFKTLEKAKEFCETVIDCLKYDPKTLRIVKRTDEVICTPTR